MLCLEICPLLAKLGWLLLLSLLLLLAKCLFLLVVVVVVSVFAGEVQNLGKEMKKCLVEAFKKVDEEFLRKASEAKPTWKVWSQCQHGAS